MTLLLLFQGVGGPPPSPVDVSLRGLLCVERTTQADFLAFIAAFDVLIAGQDGLTSTVLDYLDQDTGDGELTVEDRDYWLDLILQRAGYTGNRLPWGSATPLTLSQADPLGLTSNPNAIIIDPDAIDDGNPSSTTGVVKVTYGGGSTNPCTLLDGTPKSPADLFSDAPKTLYRYRLWDNLQNLNETGGASSARFPSNGGRVTVYVRASVNTHTLMKEVLLRKIAAHTALDRITIRGYPGEYPTVYAGNSLDNEVTPTTVGTTAMFTMGTGSTVRVNTFFSRIDFVQHRNRVGASGLVYAWRLFSYPGTSSGGLTHNKFRETQFIRPDDPLALIYPDLVDSVWALRQAGAKDSSGVSVTSGNFKLRQNYIEPVAIENWPANPSPPDPGVGSVIYQPSTFDSVWLDIVGGSNVEIIQNKFAGLKSNSMVRCLSVTNLTIRHNDAEVYDKVVLDIFNSTNVTIELNRIGKTGDTRYQAEGGGAGIQISYCNGVTIQDNIVFNAEPIYSLVNGISIRAEATDCKNVIVRRNILYLSKLNNSRGGTDFVLENIDEYNNLIVNVPANAQTRDGPDFPWNATVQADLRDSGGTAPPGLQGMVTIHDNGIVRAEIGQPHLTVIVGSSTSDKYTTSDPLTGWTNNQSLDPLWAGNPANGDFRLLSASPYFNQFLPTMPFVATPAWDESPLLTLCAIDFFVFTTTPNLGEFTTDDNAGDILTLANVGDFTTVESVT